jgi:SAM-dependent methyltransferase
VKQIIKAEVPCNSCGASEVAVLEHLSQSLNVAAPSRVVQCQRCDLVYLSPWPAEEQVSEVYQHEEYFQRSPCVAGNETVAPHIPPRLVDLERRLGGKGRLLDVGCASGTFVAYALAEGWQAEGVDVSAWASEEARKHGLTVRTGTLEEQHYPAASFDVVHSSHTLEHVPDPLGTLREMRRITRAGGWLSLEVPQEVEGLFEGVRDLLHLRTPPAQPNPHLYFFTHKTLRQMVEQAGFVDIEIKTRHPPISGKSKYPCGTPITLTLFWLDNALLQGANLELTVRVP